MVLKIDLNSDLGESFGRYKLGLDEEVMKYVTSANVACGYHAGDPLVMRKTVKIAKENNVMVGAHPGYPDLMGFGRRYMKISREEARNYVLYQIGALYAFLRTEGLQMQHVKPHGALYNALITDEDLAYGVLEGVLDFDKDLIFVALAGSKVIDMASDMGLKVAREAFADRAYTKDGTLVPRNMPGAIIHDREEVVSRVLSIVEEKRVKTIDGTFIEIEVDTICVHGDNPEALELVKYIRQRLEEEGIEVLPMGRFL
ncbi:MAG TPA: LamB/YcsF family protein [Euryarchaeota archaeon]|nr:LamB/YcsF family protein [Euryarchaeota archaeon]